MTTRTTYLLLGVAMCLLAFATIVLARFMLLWPLARSAEHAAGKVVRLTPERHSTFEYAFDVRGRSFAGSSAGSDERVGAPVSVSYLPERPGHNITGDPKMQLAALHRDALILCPLAGLFAVAVTRVLCGPGFSLPDPIKALMRYLRDTRATVESWSR